jgi:hypothetical protein
VIARRGRAGRRRRQGRRDYRADGSTEHPLRQAEKARPFRFCNRGRCAGTDHETARITGGEGEAQPRTWGKNDGAAAKNGETPPCRAAGTGEKKKDSALKLAGETAASGERTRSGEARGVAEWGELAVAGGVGNRARGLKGPRHGTRARGSDEVFRARFSLLGGVADERECLCALRSAGGGDSARQGKARQGAAPLLFL